MRVLLAGASGAVGTPLTRQLIAAGHEVIGISRSRTNAERLRSAGAEAVVADVLNRDGLLAAVRDVRADAVIHELTALGTVKMRDALQGTNELRTTGTANLLAAARAVGAHRFVTQSIMLGYGYRDHGPKVITEDDPFGEPVGGLLGGAVAAMRSAEEQTFSADEMEGVALRYGFFYGQDSMTRMMVNLVRKRRLPVASSAGFANFIYLEDAAAATVAALEKGRAGQAYNIVDDEPVRWGDYLDTMAAAFGARRPWRVPSWLLRPIPYVHAMMTTSMRVSNAKAKRELGWAPAVPTYREGIPLVARAGR
ncbi:MULTISPECIES: NAD(P)-dependent oxidoreductase [Micromonospora]|uniref:NAD(P)-dependent oxidoreductase n=1 Tax=Micromonospora solifontis TaxID=2487138 RepID=A0ABX9WBZ0_9ACTN|nr:MULTISPECIES: NAD(P)-dependent oxidoreductase [Micromonospora]NES17271.1 NAD(P)-dependent oxidoreductase [Micromonospora sp. PPF5-17B]NES39630.1 NAD(P)-dependent oxidoreductase [Micromonospora solifontis]NES59095.1 NAD(P)-dependent oxidoreductase [Micromonospora sp. PPF5-6]RNL87819.1 NAD(P)-dependent oxidoreductase [Micromonospora solifontis]